MTEFKDKLFGAGVVPVIVMDDAANAVPLAKTLYNSGIKTAEITFRTKAAPEAVRLIKENVPEVLVGAGTVSSVAMAEIAVKAGAAYIVMAGYKEDVVKWCVEKDIPVFPGVTTPTEVMMATAHGLKDLKFFPAEQSGGIGKLKAFAAVFEGVTFMPTGGINKNNITDYLALPNVEACGGSWICSKQMINEGRFDEIGELCKEAVAIAGKR